VGLERRPVTPEAAGSSPVAPVEKRLFLRFSLRDQLAPCGGLGSVMVSAELLGQSDDDALRATQEAEPVDVLVLRDLADEFGTVAPQAGNDVVDVVDSEHDAAYAQRVRRRAFRLGSDRRRRVELRQLK